VADNLKLNTHQMQNMETEKRRASKRFPPIISLVVILAGSILAARADDSSYDAAVYREIQSVTPQLNRMIGAATQESLRLATGGLAPRSPDFDALLNRPDSRFTTFSDQKVPVAIRYLEFMRQDLLRTLEPMQEFARQYQQCGLLRPLTPDNLVNATYRAQTLQTLQCIQNGVPLALKNFPDIAKSEDARVSLLKLPPRSEAAVRQYFAQRASGWADSHRKVMDVVSNQAQPCRIASNSSTSTRKRFTPPMISSYSMIKPCLPNGSRWSGD
jgi:hypothetical protein